LSRWYDIEIDIRKGNTISRNGPYLKRHLYIVPKDQKINYIKGFLLKILKENLGSHEKSNRNPMITKNHQLFSYTETLIQENPPKPNPKKINLLKYFTKDVILNLIKLSQKEKSLMRKKN
jgi:hypothetical protein